MKQMRQDETNTNLGWIHRHAHVHRERERERTWQEGRKVNGKMAPRDRKVKH